jgi:hypothetical protein
MQPLINLPSGNSMFQRGHILTLGGYWDSDLLDEFEYGLNGLRQVLPRAPGQKFVTLHLFNFSVSARAVSTALSLVRRTFIEFSTEVAVVAEGDLGEAGLLFLAGSQRSYRKIFVDTAVEVRLRSNNFSRAVGFNATQSERQIQPPVELRLLPAALQQSLLAGETLTPSVLDLPTMGIVDKLLARN